MKKLIMFNFFLLILFSGFAQENTVNKKDIIKPKKVFLQYHGKKDSLVIPVVSDKYPALKKALSPKRLFDGTDLSDIVKSHEEDGHGIIGCSYIVTYVNKNVISIAVKYKTMGAYPGDYLKWFTIDIKSGKHYDLSKEISEAGLTKIFLDYKRELNERIRLKEKELLKDSISKEVVTHTIWTLQLSANDLKPKDFFSDYLFSERGIFIRAESMLSHMASVFDFNSATIVYYDKLLDYKKDDATVLTTALCLRKRDDDIY